MPPGRKQGVDDVGRKIRETRTAAGRTPADLAQAAGIPAASFSRPEARGHPASPRALARIAGTLVVDGGVIDPGSD